MDEQILNNQQQTTPAAAPATPTAEAPAAQPTTQQTTPLQSGIQAQPAENLPAGVSDYSAQIQQMYDAQLAAKQQSMEDAYNQNLVTMQRAKEQVAPTYFNQGNDLATQYERTRRNNNLQADANGLNTGAGSQMALAQQSNFLDAFGRVRAAQANAERQADQQIADLEVAYKSQVAQALADNDYQKATALLAEYQRRDNAAEEMRRYNYQQQLADAKLRASYGDFGGYEAIYGADTANAMREFFLQANPDYAYANGLMTVDNYYKLTGRYPAGYTPPSSGYGRSGGTPSGKPLDDRAFADTLLELAEQSWRDNDGHQLNAGDDYYSAIGNLDLTDDQKSIAGAVWANFTRTQNGAQTQNMDTYKQIQGKPNAASTALFG